MRQFIKALIEAGINQAQIQMMARNNPATLLGLDQPTVLRTD
jgi:predicted metal-dependent phosphotriesterase family hydrolase